MYYLIETYYQSFQCFVAITLYQSLINNVSFYLLKIKGEDYAPTPNIIEPIKKRYGI